MPPAAAADHKLTRLACRYALNSTIINGTYKRMPVTTPGETVCDRTLAHACHKPLEQSNAHKPSSMVAPQCVSAARA